MDQGEKIKVTMKFIKDWPEKDADIVHDGLILLNLHREIDMLAEIIASRQGVPARQMEILEILFHHPEKQLTPAQLADEVHLTRSTMTGNLDNLEKKGFIARESHPSDRRMMLITLTPEGAKFCNDKMPERYNDILNIIGILSPEDRDHMKRIYARVLSFLKEKIKEGID